MNFKYNKINKILFSLLGYLTLVNTYADNTKFQNIDTNVNLGYGFSQMTLANGAHNQTLQQNQSFNLEVERLFANGIWADIVVNTITVTNSLGNKATGVGQGDQPLTQNPYLAGLNAKLGYAYTYMDQTVQLIPYVLAGRNTNLAMSTLKINNQNNVTNNDFFYTSGLGGRLEFLLTPQIDLYLDQSVVYNFDQSGPANGVQPQNNMIYTTTVGVKYNPCEKLLLGVNMFYNNYQYMAAVPPAITASGGNSANGDNITMYQPKDNVGVMMTVGMTY